VVFETDYDEIEFQNIAMMSFQWRHHHYVTEKRHQNNSQMFFLFFSYLGLSQSKFLATPVVFG